MSRRRDRELDEEVRAHLEMATRDRIERGEAPDAAAEAARREFGNVALVREVTREMWGRMWLERLVQDVRYAVRVLRRAPAFTIVAILSLALGIGANAAIFQVINAVRLRTLPIDRPHELVEIAPVTMDGARGSFASWRAATTNPIWEQLRDRRGPFSGLFAWGAATFDLASGGETRPARALWVSGSFFSVLGLRPEAGRLLTPADDRRGCAPRAVISHGFWQREFGGDRTAVGRMLRLDARPVEIVGIAPAGFFGLEVGRSFDVAVPICAEPALAPRPRQAIDSHTEWWLIVMGRLAPGATRDEVRAALASWSPEIFRATLAPNYPPVSVPKYLAMSLNATPASTGVSLLREDYESPLWILLALAAIVLVIASANLANLMFARASAREREIAIRLGLGASRGRVVRQLLTESLILTAAGAAGAVVVAAFCSEALVSFVGSDDSPVVLNVAFDWRVIGFTMMAGAIACALFGVAPAIRATGAAPAGDALKGGRGLTATRRGAGIRRALVVSQVALSLVLLVGALLFTRTLRNLATEDTGFRREGVLMTGIDFRRLGLSDDQRLLFRRQLAERLRALPGVDGAAITGIGPLSGDSGSNDVTADSPDGVRTVHTFFNRVSDGYFATMGIPMVAGRDFDTGDTPGSPLVAIVNQEFVRRAFADGRAIGRRYTIEVTSTQPATTYEIVGVVGNTKYETLREAPLPIAYRAISQDPQSGGRALVAVRSRGDIAATAAAITDSMRELNPSISVSFDRLETQVARGLLRERLMATLSGFFGAIATLLAVVGLYGVIAYGVTRRTNEIGLRLALGAGPGGIVRMILREAGVLVAVGVVIGLVLARAASGAARSLLFGLEPRDPASIAVAVVVLGGVAFVASYLPARAAARIEPTVALRTE